jgi:hypothetical protein
MKKINVKVRVVLFFLCTAMLGHCWQNSAWASYGVSTDRRNYAPGESIRVHFSGAPGYNRDWICIVPSDSPDTDGGDYQYMPGGMSQGTLTFTAPAPGNYEVRAYYNYQTNGYRVSSRYPFTVQGQRIFSESDQEARPPHHSDAYEEPPATAGWDGFDPVVKQAQYLLAERGYDPGPPDGMYGARTETALREYQRDNQLDQTGLLDDRTLAALGLSKGSSSYQTVRRPSFQEEMVATDKRTYFQGESIRVHFSGAPGYNRDWICIVPADSPDTDAGNFQYMPVGVNQGDMIFIAPNPGNYEVRAYYNYQINTYRVSVRYPFRVVNQ